MYYDFLDISCYSFGPLALAARLKGVWLEGGYHISGPRLAGLDQVVGPEGLLVYIRGPSSGSRRRAPLGGPWHEPVDWVPQSACAPFGISRGSCVRAVLIVCLRLLAPITLAASPCATSQVRMCKCQQGRPYICILVSLFFTGWQSDTYRWGHIHIRDIE